MNAPRRLPPLGDRGRPRQSQPPTTQRITAADVDWVRERLTQRDWQIVQAVGQLRVLSGEHIQDLCFTSLTSVRSQVVSRGRVLRRLVAWHVLLPLERRIGGSGRGSSASAFALNNLGQRLLIQQQRADGQPKRIRRPHTPTERSLHHALALAELYVRLVCLARAQGITLAEYTVEPRWPDGTGGHLGPDAYLRLELGNVVDHWAVEVDRSTEDLETTLRRKLTAYLDFLRRGQSGPHGVMPRVLVSCTKERRPEAVQRLVRRLPPPADELFAIVRHDEAAAFLWRALHQ